MTLSSNMKTTIFMRLICAGTAAIAALLASSAVADEPNPYAMANNTWITISGTVESVREDSFTLDYGDGLIVVEMDDGDRDADAYKLLTGDKVTVAGIIDDDFYELRTIEAGSVFVENLGTTFFASPIDEETSEGFGIVATVPVVVSDVVVTGTVSSVDDQGFTVDTGLRKLSIDVESMPFDPLDDEGYLKVDVGDRVKVRGDIDHDLFDGHQIEADYIVELHSS